LLSLFNKNDEAQCAQSNSDMVIRSPVKDNSNSPRLSAGYLKD
jgi:hypothetical protein